jgi:hypothetical protein
MSDQPKDWPKGLRRISNISLMKDAAQPRVSLTVWRVNRGTGYADPIEMGAMTVEDFAKFAGQVADLQAHIEGRGKLLVESLGGLGR